VYTALAGNSETDLVIDINGYFAPPSGSGLLFYPTTPCRLVDTREPRERMADFGAPSLSSGIARVFTTAYGPCSLPPSVRALSLNATVVPAGPLAYLTLWPPWQQQPGVSTLNAFGGDVVANAAIVPVVQGNGLLSAYALVDSSRTTDLILDINGYFAP
jgi:hypothetical protein